ncbi:MAG: OsmC family protein [Thermoplasmatota archaeon]
MSTEIARGELLGPKSTRIQIRQFTLIQDKPPESGGNDRGPMASEYLLAALAACTLTTAARIAATRHVEMTLRVETQMDFDDRGEVSGFRMTERVDSKAERKDVETVLNLTERACTISKLLARKPDRIVEINGSSSS